MTPLEFIKDNYHPDPRGSVKLVSVLRTYRATLPAGMTISREGFLSAIRKQYPVGLLSDNTLGIGGISESPSKVLAVDSDGRLRLQPAT